MTPFQKIIKYAAIAFGTYLTVIIISVAIAIVGGIFAVSGAIDNWNKDNYKYESSYEDEYYYDDYDYNDYDYDNYKYY